MYIQTLVEMAVHMFYYKGNMSALVNLLNALFIGYVESERDSYT